MKTLVMIFILFFSLQARIVQAADWIWVAGQEKSDKFYLDISDIHHESGIISFRFKHEPVDTSKYDGIKTFITKAEYRYSDNRFRFVNTTAYYVSGEIGNSNELYPNWEELPPPSPLASLCGAAIYNYFEQQQWVIVDAEYAYLFPKQSENYLYYWERSINKVEQSISYLYMGYKLDTHEQKMFLIASKPKSNQKIAYRLILLQFDDKYYRIDPNSRYNDIINKITSKVK